MSPVAGAPLLALSGLTRRFGGLVAVDDVNLVIPGGELHAIIGPNGAGKTTLFNLLSGEIAPSSGRIRFLGRDVTGSRPHAMSRLGMARTLQIKSVFPGMSVYENVWIAAHSRERWFHPLRAAASIAATRAAAEAAIERVGLQRLAGETAANLAYGDVALLELAMAVATRPRLLLLDEPVSGMSPEETDRTASTIKSLSKTTDVLLIEHDMDLVFGIADRITVMVQGGVLCQGTAAEISADARVQEAYLGAPDEEEAGA